MARRSKRRGATYVAQSRHGTMLYVRIIVPPILRPIIGRTEIKRSLHTTDRLLGTARATAFAHQVTTLFKAMAEKKNDPPAFKQLIADAQGLRLVDPITPTEIQAFIEASKQLGIGQGTAQPPTPTKPIAELLNMYVAEGQSGWVLRTKKTNIRVVTSYADYCSKTGLSPFLKTSASEYKAKVLVPKLNTLTLNKELGKLKTFFTWCKDNGYLTTENPFDRLKVRGGTKPDRDPYSFDEVKLLLDNLNPANDTRHWFPLICVYSGARKRECAQLRVQDVKVVQGVHCFVITECDDDKHMSVKNGQTRVVPIHDELLRRGFLTYVDELQIAGETQLFPMWKPHEMDGYGEPAGRWYLRTFRERIGLKRNVHELRNTTIHALNEAKVVESHINSIVGHQLGQSTSLSVYARDISVKAKKEALDMLPVNPGRK